MLKDNSVITSTYFSILSQSRHDPSLRDYIMKKTKWSNREFNMVDRISHENAFKPLTRHQKITMAKLIHNLANTNKQNYLYYRTSPSHTGKPS
jgi:hypothetical protein